MRQQFIGRERERSSFLDSIRTIELQLPLPHAHYSLVQGEPGIGKTHFLEECAHNATKRGWCVLWGRARQENEVYSLWVHVLRQLHWPDIQHILCERPEVFAPLSILLPELASFFPTRPLASMKDRHHLWNAIEAVFMHISMQAPLLIVLDDLHWADSWSQEVLAWLARRIDQHPVVVLGACRINEIENTVLFQLVQELQREHRIAFYRLGALLDHEMNTIVTQIHQFPPWLVRLIQERACGNPFFAEELARSLEHSSEKYLPMNTRQQTEDILPDTIATVLNVRLLSLTPACLDLLRTAAILGGRFSLPLMMMMGSNNEDALLDLVEEALQAGLLTEEEMGTQFTYTLSHPLLTEHLYSLFPEKRPLLHQRAAEVISSQVHDKDEMAATLVHHLSQGGTTGLQLTQAARRAGDRAYVLCCYPEAERLYTLCLTHEEETSFEILERLGECAMIQGKYEAARASYEQVLDLRIRQIVPEEEREQAVHIQAILWSEIAWTWRYLADSTQALEANAQGEKLLHERGILSGPGWACLHYQLASLHMHQGHYHKAYELALVALDEVGALSNHLSKYTEQLTRMERMLFGHPINIGRVHTLLAASCAALGQDAKARDYLTQALDLYEHYGYQREIAIASGNLGDLALRQADHCAALTAFQRSASIAEHMGDLPTAQVAVGNLGILAARTGNIIEAKQQVRDALLLASEINDTAYVCFWQSYLAWIFLCSREIPQAKKAIAQALILSRRKKLLRCLGLALLVLAQIRLAEDESKKRLPYVTRVLIRALATMPETEIQLEILLTLAQVHLRENALDTAQERIKEAQQEQGGLWLRPRTLRIQGQIQAAQGKNPTASFAEALQLARTYGLRLEEAQTLEKWGQYLTQRGISQQEGCNYLLEAKDIRHACQLP